MGSGQNEGRCGDGRVQLSFANGTLQRQMRRATGVVNGQWLVVSGQWSKRGAGLLKEKRKDCKQRLPPEGDQPQATDEVSLLEQMQ